MKGATTALEARRLYMVEKQLGARGIRNERVLEAMSRIPREEFIPDEWRRGAYEDEPVSIGHGQTISQPYMTALMVQALDLQGHERVLEVGAGCGYHAAVLGALAEEVITLELIPELAELARQKLRAHCLRRERTRYLRRRLRRIPRTDALRRNLGSCRGSSSAGPTGAAACRIRPDGCPCRLLR